MNDSITEIIEKAWSEKDTNIDFARNTIEFILSELNHGKIRVAEKVNNKWIVNEPIKKAILLSFKLNLSKIIDHHPFNYFDKVKLKFTDWKTADFDNNKIRAVPGAIVRNSAYIAKNTVLMPSFINVGAYVDEGTLIDTWAGIGSCAQIGRNCHISGGVGIGGVLEPIQSSPVIIEDNCFIGARSEVAEGVIIGEGSVLSMGVFLSKSTKIYNRLTKEISYGYIPPYSVVVPGNIPSEDKSHSLYAAIIVKQVDSKTRDKVSINELLRV
ncbi:MAG: 2,3,4,5-tetrahydropyridine-2,6-dicarboxylate N-succinyltransferase [Pseudomonadota bacterium]